MPKKQNEFIRHFRIYFKNNHPAYIVDEEGNMYVFHRVTHSKTSGGKKNWEKENPLVAGGNRAMYIVKHEEKDLKSKFSKFPLAVKDYVDITYPEIKKPEANRHLVVLDTNPAKTLNQNSKRNATRNETFLNSALFV